MKKKKDKRILKLATNVRVNAYELTRARKLADKLGIRLSDYFNTALHDSNDKFEGILCGKKSALRD